MRNSIEASIVEHRFEASQPKDSFKRITSPSFVPPPSLSIPRKEEGRRGRGGGRGGGGRGGGGENSGWSPFLLIYSSLEDSRRIRSTISGWILTWSVWVSMRFESIGSGLECGGVARNLHFNRVSTCKTPVQRWWAGRGGRRRNLQRKRKKIKTCKTSSRFKFPTILIQSVRESPQMCLNICAAIRAEMESWKIDRDRNE